MRIRLARFRTDAQITSLANGATGYAYFDQRVPAAADLEVANWDGQKSATNTPVQAWILVNGMVWELHVQGWLTYDYVQIGGQYPPLPRGLLIPAASELRLMATNTSGVTQNIFARIHGYLTPRGVYVARFVPSSVEAA